VCVPHDADGDDSAPGQALSLLRLRPGSKGRLGRLSGAVGAGGRDRALRDRTGGRFEPEPERTTPTADAGAGANRRAPGGTRRGRTSPGTRTGRWAGRAPGLSGATRTPRTTDGGSPRATSRIRSSRSGYRGRRPRPRPGRGRLAGFAGCGASAAAPPTGRTGGLRWDARP